MLKIIMLQELVSIFSQLKTKNQAAGTPDELVLKCLSNPALVPVLTKLFSKEEKQLLKQGSLVLLGAASVIWFLFRTGTRGRVQVHNPPFVAGAPDLRGRRFNYYPPQHLPLLRPDETHVWLLPAFFRHPRLTDYDQYSSCRPGQRQRQDNHCGRCQPRNHRPV